MGEHGSWDDGVADGVEGFPGADFDPADVRATLGNVASGLAEQLSSITEEMNKIRQELYGESGIGGIAKELEKLKSGGLGGLLDTSALDGMLNKTRGSSSPRSRTDRDASSVGSGATASAEARRQRTPERERELAEMRRKIAERKNKRE